MCSFLPCSLLDICAKSQAKPLQSPCRTQNDTKCVQTSFNFRLRFRVLQFQIALSLNAEGEGKNSKPAPNTSMVTAVALFDKAGDLIYIGQSKGTITVLDANSLKFLDIVKVSNCVRSLQLSCILK